MYRPRDPREHFLVKNIFHQNSILILLFVMSPLLLSITCSVTYLDFI
jgi:hypothetical protein